MTETQDVRFPLPLYASHKIGAIQSKDNQSFDVWAGLSREMAAELKERSLDTSDEELQKNTSDYKRFGEGSYEEWYSKERTPFALLDAHGRLAALVWFGPKPLGRKSLKYLSEEELKKETKQEKGEWHTIVYRSYRPYRGKGLMTPFARFCIDAYRAQYPGVKLWAGLSTENEGSMALAQKLGFRTLPEYIDTEAKWTAMALE